MMNGLSYKVNQVSRFIHPCANRYTRPMINFCKMWFDGQPVVGCEVGVARGLNSINILNSLNVKKLFLVDSYDEFWTADGKVRCFSHMKDEAVSRLKGFENTCFIFKDSKNAVEDIDLFLDFCYVDAGHCYFDVLSDLINFFPLMNQSYGVLGGHDYNMVDVRKAVRDFFLNKNFHVFTLGDDWWVVFGRKKC